MKKLALSALLVATAVAYVVPAKVHAQDDLAVSICSAIETDDKSRLRKILKNNRLKVRNIYDSVLCNSQTMLQFAFTNGANAAGAFIAKQLPVSKLSEAESDGEPILKWAEAYGYANTPLAEAIRSRIGG